MKHTTAAQLQEFEADKFAFDSLSLHFEKHGFPVLDLAFVVGVVLRFFDLCEVFRQEEIKKEAHPTHPSALNRWNVVKDLAAVGKHRQSLAYLLDEAFAVLLKAGGLGHGQ